MGTNDRVRNDAVRGRRARAGEERAVGEGKERRRATVGRDGCLSDDESFIERG